jgi:hypothetical protein
MAVKQRVVWGALGSTDCDDAATASSQLARTRAGATSTGAHAEEAAEHHE